MIAQRTSIAVRPIAQDHAFTTISVSSRFLLPTQIVEESHTVVGIRLDGMNQMAYIWAKNKVASHSGVPTWGDIRIAGLREDVPCPLLGFPSRNLNPGEITSVVVKGSLIQRAATKKEMEDVLGPCWK